MSFKLALVQLAVTSSKSANVAAAVSAVGAAARAGANIVALPVRTSSSSFFEKSIDF